MEKIAKLIIVVSLVALTACSTELGADVDEGRFGNPTMQNMLVQSGQMNYTLALAERFHKEVPDTVNFAFDSAQLSADARAILDRQAAFIRHFPEARFKVFGHTDLVGSPDYNYRLGYRRAQAVVNYLTARGISRSRLDAVVSFGKTRPLIQTAEPEKRNRRTVTEVSGFVQNAPLVLNGKFAQIIWRTYTGEIAARAHPSVDLSLGGG